MSLEASSTTLNEQAEMLAALRQSACKVPATCASTLLVKVSLLVNGLEGQNESPALPLAISILADLQAMQSHVE